MTRRQWATVSLLALLGYGALLWLFPRYSPVTQWGLTLDRAGAVALARDYAARLGRDTNGLLVRYTVTPERKLNFYLNQQPQPAIAQLFTRVRAEVRFGFENDPRFVRVTLNSAGRLLSFQATPRDDAGHPPSAADNTPSAAQIEQARAALAEWFAPAVAFSGAPAVTQEGAARRFTWKQTPDSDPRVTLSGEVVSDGARLSRVALNPQYSAAFDQAFEAQSSPWQQLAGGLFALLMFLFIVLALVFYLLSLTHGRLRHGLAWRFLVVAGIWVFGLNLFTGLADGININFGRLPAQFVAPAHALLTGGVLAAIVVLLYLSWAAGQALASDAPHRKTAGLELLLLGRWRSRYAARQLAVGGLLGGGAAALPYVLKATLWRRATFGQPALDDVLNAPSLLASALTPPHATLLLLACCFALPLLAYLIRRPALRLALTLLLGTLWLADTHHFPLSLPAAWLTGLGLAAVYYAIYHYFDLLAVSAAAWATSLSWYALGLAVQPGARLHGAAWQIGGLLIGALALALIGVWRGKETEAEFFQPLNLGATRVERERLQAEVTIAARAQAHMLPAAPPVVPGYDLAASCRPSKDVGGDLYDFLPLAGGRLGIVVADVSGKGVPAALYMTLTKGLLAAAAETRHDPGEILCEVNRHLYETCQHKVFVTLFLGVLDPATRTLTYARAGHNPAVWYNPAQKRSRWLKTAGMGLGLNQGKLFNRILAVASLELAPQDVLLFYSDGITEAMNRAQEEYGEDRLLTAVVNATAHAPVNAARVHDGVLADVKSFLGAVAPQDDQTLVVLCVS